MTNPTELERELTLLGAVTRYDDLRIRDALAPPGWLPGDEPVPAASRRGADDGSGGGSDGPAPLSREEALDLLALGEVIMRKAGYGRQLAIRTARAAGASWSQIGLALGTSKQSAWESHARWIDDQVEQRRRSDFEGMDEQDAAAARSLAGDPGSP
jgi:hypothetical protein